MVSERTRPWRKQGENDASSDGIRSKDGFIIQRFPPRSLSVDDRPWRLEHDGEQESNRPGKEALKRGFSFMSAPSRPISSCMRRTHGPHHDGGGPVSRRLPIGVTHQPPLGPDFMGVKIPYCIISKASHEHMFESVCQYASPAGLSHKPMI